MFSLLPVKKLSMQITCSPGSPDINKPALCSAQEPGTVPDPRFKQIDLQAALCATVMREVACCSAQRTFYFLCTRQKTIGRRWGCSHGHPSPPSRCRGETRQNPAPPVTSTRFRSIRGFALILVSLSVLRDALESLAWTCTARTLLGYFQCDSWLFQCDQNSLLICMCEQSC